MIASVDCKRFGVHGQANFQFTADFTPAPVKIVEWKQYGKVSIYIYRLLCPCGQVLGLGQWGLIFNSGDFCTSWLMSSYRKRDTTYYNSMGLRCVAGARLHPRHQLWILRIAERWCAWWARSCRRGRGFFWNTKTETNMNEKNYFKMLRGGQWWGKIPPPL